jgi:hypothetical protein
MFQFVSSTCYKPPPMRRQSDRKSVNLYAGSGIGHVKEARGWNTLGQLRHPARPCVFS